MRYVVALCGLLAALPAQAASSCLEAVEQMSRQYGLETSLPSSEERSDSLTDKLKSSGGVLQPPDVGAPVAVRPQAQADRMETTPPLSPQTAEGGQESSGGAARKTQLESLLAAARSAAERGDTTQCQARLAEAQQLAEAGR